MADSEGDSHVPSLFTYTFTYFTYKLFQGINTQTLRNVLYSIVIFAVH